MYRTNRDVNNNIKNKRQFVESSDDDDGIAHKRYKHHHAEQIVSNSVKCETFFLQCFKFLYWFACVPVCVSAVCQKTKQKCLYLDLCVLFTL